MTNGNGFSKFATGLSPMAGKPATFVIAAVLVVDESDVAHDGNNNRARGRDAH